MDSTYKTCFYDSTGNISHIYVFCGDDSKTPDQFFSRSEYNQLIAKKVTIECASLYIHPDDSIYDIKKKILYVCFEKEAKETKEKIIIKTDLDIRSIIQLLPKNSEVRSIAKEPNLADLFK